MGTYYTLQKCRSPEFSRPYTENGVKKSGNFGLVAPTLLPVLPPETYIRYVAATHLQPPPIENARLGPLPQLFADQFGWEDMAAAVSKVSLATGLLDGNGPEQAAGEEAS